MKAGILFRILVVFCYAFHSPPRAGADPQDNFSSVGRTVVSFPGGNVSGAVFAADGRVWAFSGSETFIIGLSGQVDQSLGKGGLDMESAYDGHIYRLDGGMIEVLSTNGSNIRSWGCNAHALAVSSNGLVFTIRAFTEPHVQVYTTNGILVREWGSSGGLQGQFSQPQEIEIGPDGLVYTSDGVFDQEGNYLRTVGASGFFTFTPEGELWDGRFAMSPDGMFMYDINFLSYGATQDYWEVRKQLRHYRSRGSQPLNAIPLPHVVSSSQRFGTTLVDINYRVIDADDSTVQTAVVALLANQTGFNSLVPIRTLVEGTVVNIGTNTPTGTNLLLTWNVAADWSTNFVNAQIEVLAKDNRGLIDVHFITIPANASNSAVTISKRGLEHADFNNAWVWLIASGNTNVALTNGNVVGRSAPYVGTALTTANGTQTTTDGRNYLYGLLNVRASTAGEVNRAQSGNFGYEGGTFPVAPLP